MSNATTPQAMSNWRGVRRSMIVLSFGSFKPGSPFYAIVVLEKCVKFMVK